MPPLQTNSRRQDAVLWEANGAFDEHGERTVTEPVEVRVRWEWCRKLVVDRFGNNVSVDAELVMDREPTVGSVLWEGSLEEWYGTGSGGSNVGLVEVVTSDRVPDIKNRQDRFEVKCRRYRSSLPTVV